MNSNSSNSKIKKTKDKISLAYYNNKLRTRTNKLRTNKLQLSKLSKGKDKKMLKNKDFNLLKENEKKQWVYTEYNINDDDTVIKNKKGNDKRCMCINYKTTNDFNTYDRCSNKVVNNTDFCELHQECKSYLRNFMSGSEPEYQPELWNNPYIEGSHNCYSYFLNRQVKAVKEKCNEICEKKHKSSCPKKDNECSDLKPQPGDFSIIKETGSDTNKERIYQCPNMQYKILADNPSIKPVLFNQKCPIGYYKGSLVVDPDSTFHFYRANKDGTFSHKPGISKVANKDASGNTIYVPHFANRDYRDDKNDDDAINYTNFCGYYCIPDNKLVHKNLA